MFINCGKAVQMLCFRGDLPTRRSVERKRRVGRQWNNTEILMQQYIEMLSKTSNKVIITDGRTPVILGN